MIATKDNVKGGKEEIHYAEKDSTVQAEAETHGLQCQEKEWSVGRSDYCLLQLIRSRQRAGSEQNIPERLIWETFLLARTIYHLQFLYGTSSLHCEARLDDMFPVRTPAPG